MQSTNGTVVIVEDERHISDLVAMYLRKDSFRVLQAQDGASGVNYALTESPRLIIVDIGLPGEIDGFEVCRQLRSKHNIPIIILTARDEEIDRILGLELGADDYVTKPFSPRELTARVHAILRRTSDRVPLTAPTIKVGDVEINIARHEVRLSGEVVSMTSREFDLLVYLAQNKGVALSRRQLLNGVWGDGWYGDTRTVDVHVRQLRKKLGNTLSLSTVWGVGYRLG